MNVTEIFTTSSLTNDTLDWLSNVTTSTSTLKPTTTSVSSEMTTAADGSAPLYIMKQITGDIPEFEIILPCIFGVFIILSLGLMVFYTKNPIDKKLRAIEMDGRGDHHNEGKMDSSWF